MNLNDVTLIGRLGKDPEFQEMPNGGSITKFSLATSESWKKKDSQEWEEKTSWHRVVYFRDLSNHKKENMKKGCLVMVKGKLSYGSYEKEGVKHYTTDINAHKVEIYVPKGNDNSNDMPDF